MRLLPRGGEEDLDLVSRLGEVGEEARTAERFVVGMGEEDEDRTGGRGRVGQSRQLTHPGPLPGVLRGAGVEMGEGHRGPAPALGAAPAVGATSAAAAASAMIASPSEASSRGPWCWLM